MKSSKSVFIFITVFCCLPLLGFAQSSGMIPELTSDLALFSAQAAGSEGIRLNWNLDRQSPTIVKFRIYRGYEELGNFAVLTELNVRWARDSVEYSYRDSTARPGVSYYYKLAAVGQSSESVFPVVITAVIPDKYQSQAKCELVPASVLPGEKINLYVRRTGRINLSVLSAPARILVNDTLRPGIYEFDPPENAAPLRLRLEHDSGYETNIIWPLN